MDDSKKHALKEHHQDLRTGIRVENILPALRTLLTDVEYCRIEDQKGNIEMVDALITILLTKDNWHFDRFCAILRKYGYEHWAHKLQNTSQSASSTGTSIESPSVSFPSCSMGSEAGSATRYHGFSLSCCSPVTRFWEFILPLNRSGAREEEARDRLYRPQEVIEDRISQASVPEVLTVEEQVGQIKNECLSSLNGPLSDETAAGSLEAVDVKALIFNEMYPEVVKWKEALQQVINHRTTGSAFASWGREMQKLMKNAASARVAGYTAAIGGGAVFTAGSGLLLGVVTAPAGIPLMVVGGVISAAGSITALCGSIVNVVKSKRIMKKAQRWVRENEHYCRKLIDAHDALMRRKAQVEARLHLDKFDQKLSEIFNAYSPQAVNGVSEVVDKWKKALSCAPEELINMFAAATVCGAAVTQGVIEGVDSGTEAAAIAAKTTAKLAGAAVAVGLSAILVAVDIGLLAKASYDLHKCRKGKPSKFAEVMEELANQVDRENTLLMQALTPVA